MLSKTLKWQAISVRQNVAWGYFSDKICLINRMKTRPSPMPWNINEYSRN